MVPLAVVILKVAVVVAAAVPVDSGHSVKDAANTITTTQTPLLTELQLTV